MQLQTVIVYQRNSRIWINNTKRDRNMKSFSEYLTESKKTYDFKNGIAGEYAAECKSKLEDALGKFGVLKVTDGKRVPISKRPLDFPQLENIDVTYFETEVTYPTTTQVLQEYLGKCCNIPQSNIIVRDPLAPQEEYQEEKKETPYEAMLNVEDMGGESAQESVAGNRTMDLLKELEKARQEREIDPMEGAPVGESSDIDDSENTKAVVGG